MKGSAIGIALLTLTAVGAHAGSWYGEVSYGSAAGSLPENSQFNTIDVDNSDGRWQLTGGYDVNPYFAVEISYANVGRQESELALPVFGIAGATFFNPFVTITDNPSAGIPSFPVPAIPIDAASLPGSAIPNKFVAETEGLRLGAIGKLPLGGRFALHFQGGTLIPRYKNTQEVRFFRFSGGPDAFSVETGTRSETEISHELEFFAGMGLNMNLSPTMAVKLYWEKFFDVGNENTFEQDIDTYNLGLRYQF